MPKYYKRTGTPGNYKYWYKRGPQKPDKYRPKDESVENDIESRDTETLNPKKTWESVKKYHKDIKNKKNSKEKTAVEKKAITLSLTNKLNKWLAEGISADEMIKRVRKFAKDNDIDEKNTLYAVMKYLDFK